MGLTILVVSLLASALTLVDQLRRPASTWIAADRRRGYWITLTVATGFVCLGVLTALAYAIGVVPRFAKAPDVDPAFRKTPGPRMAPAPSPPPSPPRPASLWLARDAPAVPPGPDPSAPPRSSGKLIIEFDDL